MKNLKFFGLAIFGAAAVYFLRQYSKIKELNFKLLKVEINKDELTNLLLAYLPLKITANIVNPTDFEIEVKSLKLDIYLNDTFLGNVFKSFPVDTIIKAKNKTPLIVNAQIDLTAIGKTLRFAMDYFQGLKKGKIYIKGFVISNFGSYQINENINI